MDMDRTPHFAGAGEGSRAGQAGVEDRHTDRFVSLEAVVMEGEGEGSTGLQSLSHRSVNIPKPLGELGEAASFCLVASELVG